VRAAQVLNCCFIAPDSAAHRAHLASHGKAEAQAVRFYCTYPGCDKSFCRGYSLKYHQYTHNDNAPFMCPEPGCGKKFSHQSRLKRHACSHRPEERSFVCEFPGCTKRFSQKCHLKIHLQSHTRRASVSGGPISSSGDGTMHRRGMGSDSDDGFISDV
jgi:uncharacterized Zn-finger protein